MTAAAETDIFKIQRNLSDAGFTPSLIQKFLSLSQQKKSERNSICCWLAIGRSCSRNYIIRSIKSTASTTWSTP